jgi:hypothetical protein
MDTLANWFHVFNATTYRWLDAEKEWSEYQYAAEFSTLESAQKAVSKRTSKENRIIILADHGVVE